MSNPVRAVQLCRPRALALALSLAGGLSLPFVMLPRVDAATIPPAGTVELSPTPVNQTQSVPPNLVVTFDDSGSMAWDYMSDSRPFDDGSWSGPWKCAGVIDPAATSGIGTHVMNGVYYNPNVTYVPPVNANGMVFPNADATLKAVWNDGVTANRPLNPGGKTSTTDFTNQVVTQGKATTTQYWQCPYDAGTAYSLGVSGNKYSTTSRVAGGGPYYYRYTGPAIAVDQYGNPTSAGRTNLYKASNWTAVAVPADQYQNWANWWAYYHTRNQMARTAASRVFASPALASTTADAGYGGNIRVVWQNLNVGNFKLPDNAIISALIDTSGCGNGAAADPQMTQQKTGSVKVPPDCYRSAFYNWLFQIPASNSTPSRSALMRAGEFFKRGNGNTGGTGDLHDPYWQPPATGKGDGNELTCRQNFHLLITDGLWNTDTGLPAVSSLTQPKSGTTLPDGVAFPATAGNSVTAIYAPQHDNGTASSLSDVAFHYWATNLRPDLYNPSMGNFVAPYLPDQTISIFNLATKSNSSVAAANVNQEIYFNPRNDPATWPHMSEYLVGLGVNGVLNFSDNTDCIDTSTPTKQDACNLRKGMTNSNGTVGWPQPSSTANSNNGSPANIDDTWHAALAGRGQFFSAGNPQQLVDQLSNILSNILARAATPTTGAVNASVATSGALSFNTGYSTQDWSGVLQAVTLKSDGTFGGTVWDAGAMLNGRSQDSRLILTASRGGNGIIGGMAFTTTASFDAVELAGLKNPALTGGNDTLANRVLYLRGDRNHEADGTYRTRSNLLGAIINAQPVYVSYAAGGYSDRWPRGSAEAATGAQSYDAFVGAHLARPGTVYMAANDGMLHAFSAALKKNADGSYGPDQEAGAGTERWAFIPRAVYANLGNLTNVGSFKYAPTVDATPVTRDVFFTSDRKWHTILVGGVGLGGRGVYALDITDPAAVSAGSVLWEFDSDAGSNGPSQMTGCVSNIGTCRSTDLGFTFGQPNIGRLASGQWVVIVPNGYFPDCSQTDKPPNCDSGQAPKDVAGNPYSALFVLDARTGAVVAELKTPTDINGVTSFGLATPVMGDYDNDQIDDVAFAGDLQGNLWRFDLSNPNPSRWTVALAYRGTTDANGKQGVQPITVMPRLFPDPTTNRFIVVFGTGKYLGAGDNTSNSAAIQSVYGIRDKLDGNGTIVTVTQGDLVRQTLSEELASASLPDGKPNPVAGAILRKLTNYAVPASAGGWYFNLMTTTNSGVINDAGERVVVTPGAIFSSNTAVISTLIPGSSDPCNPSAKGAIMFIDAATGGAGKGQSSLGGSGYVGGRADNVRTGGSLPVVSALGGGRLYLPGVTYAGAKGNNPVSGDAPIWRRRSWQEIQSQ